MLRGVTCALASGLCCRPLTPSLGVPEPSPPPPRAPIPASC
uniref:Uncharacterized protein n=1 Tax=Anopheles christyi TaxID=43041 RepID=A0A182KI10_9DIPT